jgi:hypothetical protein
MTTSRSWRSFRRPSSIARRVVEPSHPHVSIASCRPLRASSGNTGTSARLSQSREHPEPQWILDAWDVEKGVIRSFAMRDIHSWEPDT